MNLCHGPCGEMKPLTEFHNRRVSGRVYPKVYCIPCDTLQKKKYELGTPERKAKVYKKHTAYQKHARMDWRRRACYLLKDLRKSDKRSGLSNDLDIDFVREKISGGCSYCGASQEESRMSLDRIDNAIGHMRANIVAACVNCNLTRGNMPYTAWLLLAPAMREARVRGLLSGWLRRK